MFGYLKNVMVPSAYGALASTLAVLISYDESLCEGESHHSTRKLSKLGVKTPHISAKLSGGVKSLPLVATSAQNSSKVSFATYNANDPTEDRFVTQLGKSINNNFGKGQLWNLAAVFDGHGGWQVAEFAHNRLLDEIVAQMESHAVQYSSSGEAAENSILLAYRNIELEYLNHVREAYRLGFGEVGKVGACALVVLHDPRSQEVFVGNAGDCRAVLGSVSTEGSDARYLATRITRDHNARMPLELLTLQKEHPGESDVVVCKSPTACYVKGRLQLTRALGDAYLKYPEFNAAATHRGRHIRQPYTPPYVKATPDVHRLRIGEADKFVVIASDGVWDHLSDDDAVKIVGDCLRRGDGHAAAREVVEQTLTAAAAKHEITLSQIKEIPPAYRRSTHDDTTVVVLYF